jgi:hypothetical protein
VYDFSASVLNRDGNGCSELDTRPGRAEEIGGGEGETDACYRLVNSFLRVSYS